MPNSTITNVDLSSVYLADVVSRDALLTFAGAGTVVAGTILARKAVEDAVVAAADGGNTGDGTATLATVVAGTVVPIVGAYVFEITTAVTNGGVGKLVDPNGALVSSDLIMTVGAGAATVFEAGGLQFTITDAATDFVAGDKFTLTVSVDGKMVPFAIAGAGGAQIPKAVLTYDVTAAGAGDESIRQMISGTVRAGKLIIDADGDGSNVDVTVLEQLRDYSILSIDVQELNILDNQ